MAVLAGSVLEDPDVVLLTVDWALVCVSGLSEPDVVVSDARSAVVSDAGSSSDVGSVSEVDPVGSVETVAVESVDRRDVGVPAVDVVVLAARSATNWVKMAPYTAAVSALAATGLSPQPARSASSVQASSARRNQGRRSEVMIRRW